MHGGHRPGCCRPVGGARSRCAPQQPGLPSDRSAGRAGFWKASCAASAKAEVPLRCKPRLREHGGAGRRLAPVPSALAEPFLLRRSGAGELS